MNQKIYFIHHKSNPVCRRISKLFRQKIIINASWPCAVFFLPFQFSKNNYITFRTMLCTIMSTDGKTREKTLPGMMQNRIDNRKRKFNCNLTVTRLWRIMPILTSLLVLTLHTPPITNCD